jgi:hypothetical protein
MLQVRRGLDLGEKPFAAEDRAELGVEHLDRDVSFVAKIACEIHGGHATGADLALDGVATRKRGGEAIDGFPHGAITCCERREIARYRSRCAGWRRRAGSSRSCPQSRQGQRLRPTTIYVEA